MSVGAAWRALAGGAVPRRAFLAGLGAIHVVAFASLLAQVDGLIGSRGIAPVADWLPRMATLRTQLPTLCWLDASDASLHAQCVAGIAFGLMLALGVAPLVALPCLSALYLSLTVAGQEFLRFQWDALLLETTFCAWFVAPAGLLPWGPPRWLRLARRRADDPRPPPPTVAGIWALRLLAFRLLFASGWVKLSNDDATWRDLTALDLHFLTQPLPTPLAWHVAQWPEWTRTTACAAMFALELGAPLLLFCGRHGRALFGVATIAFMVVLAATGNYGFFEPLTIVLCLPLFGSVRGDERGDGAHRDARPAIAWPRAALRTLSGGAAAAAALLALVPFGASLVDPPLRFPRTPWLDASCGAVGKGIAAACFDDDGLRLAPLLSALEPYGTWCTYGLFRVMTTERDELVIEGSDDGVDWRPYELPYKPGDPAVAPRWVAPHMPRLDWQLWFAALDAAQAIERDERRSPRWVATLLRRLLDGEPAVLRLFARDPFGGKPPRQVRIRAWRYRFTTPAERAASGDWWSREPLGIWFPAIGGR